MPAKERDMSPNMFFFRQFLKNPRMIGSIIPTSRAAVDRLLAPIDLSNARCVVEYGPGTGVFTSAILARCPSTAQVIAIDTNPDFVHYLRETIKDDRFVCVDGSAVDVEAIVADLNYETVDYVVSGLPFSTLPDGLGAQIMRATQRVLAPSGQFLIYQYSRFVIAHLLEHFKRVDQRRAWQCIPPAYLFWAHKTAEPLRPSMVYPTEKRSPLFPPKVESTRDGVIEHADKQEIEPPPNAGKRPCDFFIGRLIDRRALAFPPIDKSAHCFCERNVINP